MRTPAHVSGTHIYQRGTTKTEAACTPQTLLGAPVYEYGTPDSLVPRLRRTAPLTLAPPTPTKTARTTWALADGIPQSTPHGVMPLLLVGVLPRPAAPRGLRLGPPAAAAGGPVGGGGPPGGGAVNPPTTKRACSHHAYGGLRPAMAEVAAGRGHGRGCPGRRLRLLKHHEHDRSQATARRSSTRSLPFPGSTCAVDRDDVCCRRLTGVRKRDWLLARRPLHATAVQAC